MTWMSKLRKKSVKNMDGNNNNITKKNKYQDRKWNVFLKIIIRKH